MSSRSQCTHVEIVVAEGTYHIHLPTKKANDAVRYTPRPGELIVVYVRPSNEKLIGVPLRPNEEPMFIHHFIKMVARYSQLPWVVSVNGVDIEHRVRVLFAQMCRKAHQVWPKGTPNMLKEPISCGFMELKRWEPGTTLTVNFHENSVASLDGGNVSASRSQPSPDQQAPVPASFSGWANSLFRSASCTTSITSSMASMGSDSVDLFWSPGSPDSNTSAPPLQSCASPGEQPAESSPALPSSAAVRAAFDRMIVPTSAWWNGLRR